MGEKTKDEMGECVNNDFNMLGNYNEEERVIARPIRTIVAKEG